MRLANLVPVACVLLVAGCAGAPLASPPERHLASADFFTVIALPDTQYYSAKYPETFRAQTRWIAEQRERLNIQLVVGLGDIVDDGGQLRQWRNAQDAVAILDAQVPDLPNVFAIGNHDYDRPRAIAASRRRANQYNRHFGDQRIADRRQSWVKATYEPGHAENSYSVVSLGGQEWAVLTLEFDPRDAVLEWADRVLDGNPSRPTIVVTHSYGFSDDTWESMCDAYDKRTYGLEADNNGDEVWEKSLRRHANVRWVLSGHIPFKGTGRRTDLGDAGNPVHQLLSDYQEEGRGGDGYLRILTFHPRENRVDISTYSPVSHPPFRVDARNQFSLPLANAELGEARRATLHGVVKSGVVGQGCRRLAGVQVGYGDGRAVTADAAGRFKITVPVTRAFETLELAVSGKGWKSATVAATLEADGTQVREVYLLPAK